MATESQVKEALYSVRDPELHQSIVDLNMVRRIGINGDRVSVDVALTVAGCPLHQRIEEDVKNAVGKLDGVGTVAVTLSVMNEAERRQAFSAAFRASQAPRTATSAQADSNAAMQNPRSAPTATVERPSREIPVRAAGPEGPPLLQPTTTTRIIGIASGKGGVGKSTVTANLAVALAALGHRVGLMDMDIYGFSQGRMLGAEGEAQVDQNQKIVPWDAHGVRLVSMGMFVPEDQAIIWRGPMLGKMMQQFFSDVSWDALDFLLVDLPPGTGDVALDVAQKVRHAGLIIVTTPQPVATRVATRAANVAQRAGQKILGVIENMSYVRCAHGDKLEVFGHGGGAELASSLGVPLLGQIPLESEVREGSDTGHPIVTRNPASEASQVFQTIAKTLAASS